MVRGEHLPNRFTLIVSSPKSSRVGGTIGTSEASSSIVGNLLLRLGRWTIMTIYFIVQATGIAVIDVHN